MRHGRLTGTSEAVTCVVWFILIPLDHRDLMGHGCAIGLLSCMDM